MASPDKFALVERWAEERTPEDIATRHLTDADIVVAEGFKARTFRRSRCSARPRIARRRVTAST